MYRQLERLLLAVGSSVREPLHSLVGWVSRRLVLGWPLMLALYHLTPGPRFSPPPPPPQKPVIWTLFEKCATEHTSLFHERHADHILLSCIYATFRLKCQDPVPFRTIVKT